MRREDARDVICVRRAQSDLGSLQLASARAKQAQRMTLLHDSLVSGSPPLSALAIHSDNLAL
eukprot:463388-Pleurochrysis_carterae.AAC.2